MLPFKAFKQAVQKQFDLMVRSGNTLFQANIDKDQIWDLYLSSFPKGANEIFRERTEHDCSACKSFIRNIGGLLMVKDNQLVSLWDFEIGEQFQPVVDALSKYVKSVGIENVYLHFESKVGVDKNFDTTELTRTLTWEHLYVTLPSNLVVTNGVTRNGKLSEYKARHDVLFRSLTEITPEAIETVKDLIQQNALYRGAEKKNIVDAFALLKKDFDKLTEGQDFFTWQQVEGPNAFVCKIRNDVIGTLLVDLSEGVELENAVKSFEDKVSGTNYQRPTALVTPRMRDAAKQKIEELGLMPALDRRFANLDDLKIENLLFADRNVKKKLNPDIFDVLPVAQKVPILKDVQEISIEKFISDVLPTAESVEVFLENPHLNRLVSLIAPCDYTAPKLFKWDNLFSWSYKGDYADSIKEKVKAAGGNVTGDVCCRLAWYNYDDLDLHFSGKNGHIYYGHRRDLSGELDVDMNAGGRSTRSPVENIFFDNWKNMPYGLYKLYVNQYCNRESIDVGFDVEVDILGEVQHFSYPKRVTGNIHVADLKVTTSGVELIPKLPASSSTKQLEAWGLKTQAFVPVTAIMLSPNYWNGSDGNKHYFFMLDGCRNDETARGFYNEFLCNELAEHRKTMELVGSKARTDENPNQMSGLGFSATQKANLTVKVTGNFTRVLKIIF